MKYTLIIALALAIIGCKPKQTVSSTEKEPVEIKDHTELTVDEPRDTTSLLPILVSETNDMKNTGDMYTVHSAKISDNILWLTVSYGGGCKEHQFEMLFNNAYSESEEGSSAIKLTLKHQGNNDRCRSIVRENIRFSLKGLQNNAFKNLNINLTGWEGNLLYAY